MSPRMLARLIKRFMINSMGTVIQMNGSGFKRATPIWATPRFAKIRNSIVMGQPVSTP
jgi:hypothetical protein